MAYLIFLGYQELLLILLIFLLIFGGAKIPDLMKALGRGIKSFKEGMREDDEPDKKKDEHKTE